MSPYELASLYLDISTKQDALWAIFFSIHIAVFGGIIYVDRPLRRTEKIFAVIAYLLFGIINYFTLRSGQLIIANLISDISEFRGQVDIGANTVAFLGALDEMPYILYQGFATLIIHMCAAILVMGAILYDRSQKDRNAGKVKEPE